MHDSHLDFIKGLLDHSDQHHDLLSQKHDIIKQLHDMGIDLNMDSINDNDFKAAIHEAIGIGTVEHVMHAGSVQGVDIDHARGIINEDYFENKQHVVDNLHHNTTGAEANEHSFCGYTKEYCTSEMEYYNKEAENAKFWYESYLKDGKDSTAMSWLKQYEDKKSTADSWSDKIKWAEDAK